MPPIHSHRHTLARLPLVWTCLAVTGLALAGCQARSQVAADGAQPEAVAGDPTGSYAMQAPLNSELRVVPLPGRDGHYRIEIWGAGDPGDGAGVGADCQAVAEGPLRGGAIDAALVPFESDLGGLEPADLQDAPRLRLVLDGDSATLEGRFDHCPWATVMAGQYRRTRAPRALVDCAPLPDVCWNRD